MATSVQSSYAATQSTAYAGQLHDSGPSEVKSVIVEAATAAGLVVVRGGTTRAEGRPPPAPATADVDAIIATGASTAGIQTLSGASLDGVVGVLEMFPPRNLTFTISSHANWDATQIVVTGTDEDGVVMQEAFLVPDAGAATLTGLKHFRTVTQVVIPAQSGTAGTFTMGFGASLGPIGGQGVHGVAMYDASRKPEAYPVDYCMPCVRKGRVNVTSESTYSDGDPVYVRWVSTGDEINGQVRNAPDASDCTLLKGARFWGTGSAGVAPIDLNLP